MEKDAAPTLADQKKALEELKTVAHDFKSELQKRGEKDALLEEKYAKMNTRMDELETILARPQVKAESGENWEKPVVTGYAKYLAHGANAVAKMDEAEKQAFSEFQEKALSVQSDTAGGILVPEDFRSEIISRLPYFANVSELVTMVDTMRDSVRWPRQTHNANSATATEFGSADFMTSDIGVTWEDETDEATLTDLSWGSVRIPTFRMRAIIRMPRELLEDSPFNIIDIISTEFARRFAITEDFVFTKGTGGKKPNGFLVNTGIPTTASGSGSNTVKYSTLVDLIYSLPEQYAKNASLQCKRTTVGEMRKIVDLQNRPLWEPSLKVGEPSTMLGVPLRINEHIPATGVANAKAVVYGDWKRVYVGVRKKGMTLQRLDEKYATSDEVAFIARQRLGGGVVGEWAARYMTMS